MSGSDHTNRVTEILTAIEQIDLEKLKALAPFTPEEREDVMGLWIEGLQASGEYLLPRVHEYADLFIRYKTPEETMESEDDVERVRARMTDEERERFDLLVREAGQAVPSQETRDRMRRLMENFGPDTETE